MEIQNIKVIFLDIDGVLNCQSDFKGRSCYVLNKEMIRRFKNLVKDTKAKVVLSSTWRKFKKSVAYLKRNGVNFIDTTPVGVKEEWAGDYTRRGAEIQAWLDGHPEVERYVIIDDSEDMLEHQMKYFVKTQWKYGLTDFQVWQAHIVLTCADDDCLKNHMDKLASPLQN